MGGCQHNRHALVSDNLDALIGSPRAGNLLGHPLSFRAGNEALGKVAEAGERGGKGLCGAEKAVRLSGALAGNQRLLPRGLNIRQWAPGRRLFVGQA